jgi:hypothetical protein
VVCAIVQWPDAAPYNLAIGGTSAATGVWLSPIVHLVGNSSNGSSKQSALRGSLFTLAPVAWISIQSLTA